MDAEKWTTEQIEAYLRHRLPEPGRSRLASELESDPGLRAEVAAYEQVLEGLDALQESHFSEYLAEWEAKAWLHDQTELIAWYLEGRLGPDGQTQIEDRIRQDPAFRTEVEAYQQLVGGMNAIRDDDFRAKMRSWESAVDTGTRLKTVHRRPRWQYAAAAVGALLIALSSFYLYLQASYSGPALAKTYYEPPISERTLGEDRPASSPLQERINLAQQQLTGGNYNAAFMAYDSLMREIPRASLDDFNKNLLAEQARWYRLLAATGMAYPPIDLIAEARAIGQSPGHEYAEDARALLIDLKSPWYRWAN